MLLDDGTIVTGTSPDAINSSVEVCHETEPYCAAFRLGRRILASVCLYGEPGGRVVVLSPVGCAGSVSPCMGPACWWRWLMSRIQQLSFGSR